MTKWVVILCCAISFSCVAQNTIDVGNVGRFFGANVTAANSGVIYVSSVCVGDTLIVSCNNDTLNYYGIDSMRFTLIYNYQGSSTTNSLPILSNQNCEIKFVMSYSGLFVADFSVEYWFNSPTNIYSIGSLITTNVTYYAPAYGNANQSLIIYGNAASCSSSDTTTNLILNHSFEVPHETNFIVSPADLDTTELPCWINPTYFFNNHTPISYVEFLAVNNLYDNSSMENGIFVPITPFQFIDGTNASLFKSLYQFGKLRHTAFMQNQLAQPLVAGQQYYFSCYVNTYTLGRIHNNSTSNPAYLGEIWTHHKNVGVVLSGNRIINSNNVFYGMTPTFSLTIDSFHNPFPHLWQKVEQIFTATGGERYLTLGGAFDSSFANLMWYPFIDTQINNSSETHEYLTNLDVQSNMYFDNFILIPLSDTGKTVINPHIPDPDSLFLETNILACNVASISLQSGADFWSYQWSTGDTTADVQVSADGTYYVTVSNGCGLYSDSVTVRFAVTDTIPLMLSADKTDLCNDTALLTASSGFDFYQWNTGDTSQAIFVTDTGTYTCIATKDCTNETTSITIALRSCCGFWGSSQSVSICTGNSYLFKGENLTQSGTYYDTLQTAQGCDSIVTLMLTVETLQSSFSETICAGSSYFFKGENLTQSGTYRDTLQTAQGCDSIVTLLLTVLPPPQESLSQTICSGSSYFFNGRNLTQSGTYRDTLQTVQGCDSIVSLRLTVLPILQNDIHQIICEGSSYFFNGQELTQSGVYADTLNCEITTLTLSVLPFPVPVSAENRFEIEYKESVTLTACATGENYQWIGENCTDCRSITVTPNQLLQHYVCIVSNGADCADTCFYEVKVNGIYGTIYVPNAFSPNGDGNNDEFRIFGTQIRLVRFSIFNRWGEKIFDTADIDNAWDGKYKGVPQPAGVYTYTLSYFSGTETVARNLKGSITLIR